MKTGRRLAAGLLAGILCLSLLPARALEGAELSIRTVEELLDFREHCTLDSWSVGKTVVLEQDLDLGGVDFDPIPCFRGTFEGGGHSIVGLTLNRKGSRQGLFRTLGEEAVIRNLRVTGSVTPQGSKCSVGLLAGESAGTLSGCTAEGIVSGETDVGGLVGINTGTLESCAVQVTVTGVKNTGGLCGSSSGSIRSCTARGAINTESPRENLTDPILNVGGITGLNTHEIQGCTNEARVGYPHVGYNVGGIAGEHQGELTGCVNSGEIQGRKGVGGIVGRFTPDLEILYGRDPIEGLNDALAGLPDLLTTLSDSIAGTVDRGVDKVEGINGELIDLRELTEDGVRHQLDLARDSLNQIYDHAQAINTAMDSIHGSYGDFSRDTDQEITRLLEDLKDFREGVTALTDALEQGGQEINSRVDEAAGILSSSSELLAQDLEKLGGAFDAIGESMTKVDTFIQALREFAGDADLKQTRSGTAPRHNAPASEPGSDPEENIDPDMGVTPAPDPEPSPGGDPGSGLLPHLPGFDPDSDQTPAWLEGLLKALKEEFDNNIKPEIEQATDQITGAIGQVAGTMNGILGELQKINKTMNQFKKALQALEPLELEQPMKDIGEALSSAGTHLNQMFEALDELEEVTMELTPAREQMRTAAEAASGELELLNDTFHQFSDHSGEKLKHINREVDAIEDALDCWFGEADRDGSDTSDELNTHTDGLDQKVDELLQGVDSSNEEIHGAVNDVIDQLDIIREAAHALTEKPEYQMDDRSEWENMDSGVIVSSRNAGAIRGDANVGGITGIISLRASDDPEEEWEFEGVVEDALTDITAVIRAGLRDCRNEGTVQARNECAGGIVGRADLGAVLNCVSLGDVTVENGAACGGIAGRTKGAIRGSSSQCLLTGTDSVGGITGDGGKLYDCLAMVELEADGERLGAVTGWTEEELKRNYALQEGVGAVDGTDLDGQAQCLDYEAFAALPALPPEFLIFELTFVADGKTIAKLPFTYNGSIDTDTLPEVPRKEENYACWEDFATSGLKRSRVVHAVYTPWDTTVSSGGSRPEVLAEGAFSPAAAVRVESWEAPETEKPWDREFRDGWSYEVTDPERAVQPTVRLRVLAQSGGDHAAVAIRTETGLTLVQDAVRDGSYLAFEAPSSGQVVILSGSVYPLLLLCGGGGAVLLLAVGLLLGRRRRKRRAAGPEAGETPASADTGEGTDPKS